MNKILLRGLRMRLLPNSRALRLSSFNSLDTFMLHIHAKKIALCLDSLISFAEKVEPLIRLDPFAHAWFLHEDILIQRQHWRRLARHVLNLTMLLGHTEPDSPASTAGGAGWLPSPDVWPGQEALRDAVRRAARVYGAHAMPDGDGLRLQAPRSSVGSSTLRRLPQPSAAAIVGRRMSSA